MNHIKPKKPVLMIEYKDEKDQTQEVNWFDLSREFRRSIKRKNPSLFEKIHGVAKEMIKELNNEVQN